MQIGMQKNQFGDAAYTTQGLTFSKCAYSDGGYYKTGNLVVLNIRVRTSEVVSSGNTLISGLPTPKTINNMIYVAVSTTNLNRVGHIKPDGTLAITLDANVSADSILVFSATYLAN